MTHWSNEELVGAADDARGDIESALKEVRGIDEYKEVYEYLEEALKALNEDAEPYERAYEEEQEKERAYENSEYERSVL